MSVPDVSRLLGKGGGDPRDWTPESSYAFCANMARSHYENFPVASRLMPAGIRRHVAAIYAFARPADDIADEGGLPISERLELLDQWEDALNAAAEGRGSGPVFTALGETLRTTDIPLQLLHDLLTAFRMDARGGGFEREEDLLRYCRFSANPVGRLVLHLFGYSDSERMELSDSVCTGLQLVNFWQDVSVDLPRGRVNIPRESMERFGYSARELFNRVDSENFRALLTYLNAVAEGYLRGGGALPERVAPLRLRMELRATIHGGLMIAQKIREMEFGVLNARPKLRKSDLLRLALRTVFSPVG